jgi:hypothetical protein
MGESRRRGQGCGFSPNTMLSHSQILAHDVGRMVESHTQSP